MHTYMYTHEASNYRYLVHNTPSNWLVQAYTVHRVSRRWVLYTVCMRVCAYVLLFDLIIID